MRRISSSSLNWKFEEFHLQKKKNSFLLSSAITFIPEIQFSFSNVIQFWWEWTSAFFLCLLQFHVASPAFHGEEEEQRVVDSLKIRRSPKRERERRVKWWKLRADDFWLLNFSLSRWLKKKKILNCSRWKSTDGSRERATHSSVGCEWRGQRLEWILDVSS